MTQTMTKLESRYPCPVCLGATLQKSAVNETPQLLIDHCVRCGGVWFDFGEVQQLRRCEPKVLWALVAEHGEVHRMQCHNCHALVARSAFECSQCRQPLRLDCPKCGDVMATGHHNGLRLDACTRCKGVWFDRHELDAIWRIELDAALQRRSALYASGQRASDASLVVLDALTFDPWLSYYGLQAVLHGGAGAAELLGGAGDLAAGAGEVVAEAASSVFETIVEIIGGIFG